MSKRNQLATEITTDAKKHLDKVKKKTGKSKKVLVSEAILKLEY